jgi:single-stranded DNA-binding protein
MSFALITGTIFRAPLQKIAKSGKPYTSCTVKAGSDDGGGDFWNVLIFSESAQLEMLRLEVGDAVAVRGKMKLEIFEKDGQARISRSLIADAAIGLRPAPRTPKAKAAKAAPTSHDQPATTTDATPEKEPAAGGPAFFSDKIPLRPAR